VPDYNADTSYLRFKNGSGKLFDVSEACERSYVDRTSEIKADSSVWSSRIIDSQITGSVVSNAIVKHSTISYSVVHGGVIEDSNIVCEYIGGNVRIIDSDVLGKSRIAHSAVIQNARFCDLTVKGKAVIKDWPEGVVIEGHHGYITSGIWTRPPRIVRMPFDVTVTESVEGRAFVACYEFPIDRWLRIGDRYGKAQGWTPEQVDMVRQALLSFK
jgi:hypothetical protein